MISGIIAEFNPFHNGHTYLLRKAQEISDAVICVMSGNFVQRGDVSIFEKHKRAEFALKNGADLIVGLPIGWSMSSAENFAYGGVSLLKNIGIVDNIVFGSENNNISDLLKIAEIINDKNFSDLIKEIMKSGITYAAARQKAIEKYSYDLSNILTMPNNTLAIEYILAAKKLNFSPTFYPIKRVGVEHNSIEANGEYMSGTGLREFIKNKNYSDIKKYIPSNIYNDVINCNYSDINRLDNAMLFKIRSMSKEQLLLVPDVNEGLENRIYQKAKECETINELTQKIKTKRYTLARIRRILACATFGVTNEYLKKEPPYIHILGCTSKGQSLLKNIAEKTTLPLIVTAKDALKLDGFAKKTFELEEYTSNLYSMSVNPMLTSYSEYNQKIIKI